MSKTIDWTSPEEQAKAFKLCTIPSDPDNDDFDEWRDLNDKTNSVEYANDGTD